MRLLLLVIASSACRLNFLESDKQGDAGLTDAMVDSSRSGDADPLGFFGTPVKVPGADDPVNQEDDPTLTQDMLELYFDDDLVVSGGSRGDIWVMTRATTADPWGAPAVVPALLSNADDTTPDLSPDGLTMFFGSDRLTVGDRDIYMTTRADRQSPWGAPTRIAELASTADDSGVCIDTTGLRMIFFSARTGNGDLYQTTRPTTASPWGTPVKLVNLDSPVEESQHWCNDDLTVIFFSKYLNTNLDIWMTTRPTPNDSFGPPVAIDELTTIYDDADPWLSPDLRTMYFYSRRSGNGDVFVTTR